MMLKNHLDMIGRNEPIQRKARFWQSYVRALKGTDDMRAPDRVSPRPRSVFSRPYLSDFPELSSGWPYNKSIYDDPIHAVDRISVPGYRYLPVSREIYGYSPRNLYPSPYRPAPFYDARKAWDDHLKRLADIDHLYPSKYPLSARHYTPTPQRELTPFSADPKDKVAYNYAGVPIYNRGGYTRRPLQELFEPVSSLPLSRITRDPWWWSYPSLRPYTLPYGWDKTPFYLRDSYLSPVKRTYLWGQHPIRPFDPIFNISDARKSLESNLTRLEGSENVFQSEETVTKSRANVRQEKQLTLAEEEFTPYSKIIREPGWWTYPSLRPHIDMLKAIPSHVRGSYLSPVKSVFHWYEHPFRPYAFPQTFYYYLWHRRTWENRLNEIDNRIFDAISPPVHRVYP